MRKTGGLNTISNLEQLKGLFGGNLGNRSLIDILTSNQFTGSKARNILDPAFYKQLQSGLLQGEQATGLPVSVAARGGTLENAPFGGAGAGGMDAILKAFEAAQGAQAGSDRAGMDLQAQLERERLAEDTRQFNESLAFKREQEAFQQKDIISQRLLESAGLATGPTGAIQLAYLARGQGAPQDKIKDVFQNLPFVKALLAGQALPGFGLPEQLGAATGRTGASAFAEGGTIQGKNLGITIPGKTGVTEQQYGGLSDFEQQFLGALGQSETGQDAAGFLEDIRKSFLPSTGARAIAT